MSLSFGRLWRGFGTALFLTIVGLGGSVLAVTVFPLISLLSRTPEQRRRRIQYALHLCFRGYCNAIHAMRLADVDFVGTEKLADLRGSLIIANHPSLLDVAMIMAATPSVQCVVKAGLWRNPFFRLTVSGAGYIRNDLKPEDLLETCLDTLRSGNNLIIFPEGTRTTPGTLPIFRRGFANLATLAPCDLQLLTITCDPPILHKGNPWWHVPKRRSRFRMEVGERLEIQPYMEYPYRALGARALVKFVTTYYVDKLANGQPGTRPQKTDRECFEAGGSVA